MTLIELIHFIVGAALGFALAPHVVPHVTDNRILAVVLTYVLALVMGVGMFIIIALCRLGIQNILRRHKQMKKGSNQPSQPIAGKPGSG